MSTYKRPVFLEKQIKSLLAQTFTDFEIIISDNDPDGSAGEVVQKFKDSRVNYQKNIENLGMVKSFNNSLSRARSEYVVMITDDDPVYPDMLESLHALSIKYPGYGMYQGGCEILCYSPFSAKVMRARVGVNSCLSSELNYDEEKIYSAEEFPYLFFKGKLGSLLLWSVGVVKRDILIANGGMPDYGTEYFTDHAFMVVNGSTKGMVYLNRALGHQAIHGENFGFNQLKNLDKYKAIPDSFSKWVEERLSGRKDWQVLKTVMQDFVGASLVEFSVFIKSSLRELKYPDANFNQARKFVFDKSYMRKWKTKYTILSKFPATFNYLLQIKKKFLK